MTAVRALVSVALALGVSTGVAMSADAVGPGDFTTITTPAHDIVYHFNGAPLATNTLVVSGRASADITTVDIECLFQNGTMKINTWASAVPVTAGVFSTTAVIDNAIAPCRLRAVPSGVDATTDYVGAYAGPIVRQWTVSANKDGSTVVGDLAVDEEGDGLEEMTDTGACGIAIVATDEAPGMVVHGTPLSPDCSFFLPQGNLTTSGTPTGSAITVDGHNAYLPSVVSAYLRATGGGLGLTLSQPALTMTSSRAGNGDITVNETAVLMRCSVDDTYPPTSTSCPSLVSSGVRFHRVLNLFRGAHQVRVRDSFTSTNGHAHTVRPAYQLNMSALPHGAVGYRFPGQGSAFKLTTPDEAVTGLGTRAATLFVRNDRYAVAGDPVADTFGFSWSKAPSKLQFSHTSTSLLAMPYLLHVPSGGSAYLGFAESEHISLSDVTKLAATATGEMVGVPAISSPANGATVHGKTTTVKGSVGLGANGLPTSVTVNGHAATLTTVSATKRTYQVTFTETLGKHTITVTAKDSAGNTRARSIKITNVS